MMVMMKKKRKRTGGEREGFFCVFSLSLFL